MLENSVLENMWLVTSITQAMLILESLYLKSLWVLGWFLVYFDLRLTSLVMSGKYGMIGYAMDHAEKHEWSDGIATLEKRENITGHLIGETK